MGEHESWAKPSGLLPSQTATVTLPLDPERWGIAEDRTLELIACIQPNIPSMERRNAVADYVRRLILKCFNCQVFTFGSVPLKTYLPDGDIDLTAFSDHHSLKDTWANEVREILENEERSEHAEFRVKEVQYIQAEVKIIKCLVENIVVDISFNQLGGLCTLCFLDEVDVVVGHNHLFKRSIILVKAWCYYESRILGAHHGLISTYALETLVLYIFHVFNNCFSGPLEVLYRFLVFFSNFDWDNYCLSLWGPIPLSALPDIAAEPPRKDGGKLLLNREFLEMCGYVYSSQGGPETQVQNFMVKFLNVVDPLRTTNNLGRSVSKGNFFRIRSAFGFGAKKLARILECPKENIISEIDQFFMNTWQRHGSGLRPDAPLDIHQLKPAWPCSDYSKSIVVCKDAEEKPAEQMEQPSSSSSSSICDERFKYLHGNQSASTGILGHPSERTNRCSTHLETVTTKGGSSSISKGVSKRSQHQISSTRSQKGTKTDISNADSQDIKGISRVYSSPELTDVTSENNARGRKGRPETAEAPRNHAVSSRNDQNVAERRRKNVSSDLPTSHILKTTGTNDSVRFRHNSSHGNVDPNNASEASNYGSTLTSANEGKGSVIQGEDMVENTHPSYQDGQVQSNLIGMSRPHFVNRQGQIPPPSDFSSLQLSVPIAPSLLTPVYAPRNISGMVRNAAPISDSAWGLGQHTSYMQFPPGHVPPMPVCIPSLGANGQPHFDDADVSEKRGSLESYQEEVEQHYDPNSWNKIEDQDTLLGHAAGFDVKGTRSSNAIHTGVTESLSQETPSSPSKLVRTQKKFAKDNREELQEERLNNNYSFSTRRMVDDNRGELNPKGATYHENEVSRTSESTWAGTSGRISKFSRDKRGKGRGHGNNEYSTSKVRDVVPSNHSKSHSSWHKETNIDGPSTADKLISQDVRSFVSNTESFNFRDQVPFELSKSSVLSIASDSLPAFSQGRNGGSISTAVSRIQPVVIPTYDSTTAVSPDAITSGDNVSPVLYGQGLQYRTGDNSGVPPFAFYPTGPPLPFFMFPLSYIPTDGSNAGDRSGSFDNMRASDDPLDSGLDHSEHFVDSSSYEMGESSEQPESHSSNMGSVDPSIDHEDEMKSDILRSDFNSHWLNLRYGRFCLNSHFPNQLFYPPSPVPPMYLQGHFPLDGPGRPLSSTNMNMLSQLVGYGHRFMPIMPLQPNASRPTNNFQRFNGPNRLYGEDLPRYRGGTGTYLPTPRQVPYQDRQPSGTKGNRSYGHDRRDHGDRDAGYVFVPKNKGAGGRNQSRYDQRHQFDRSNSRVDRNSEGKGGERTWDSYRNENRRRGSYQSNHNQFPSANPPINAGSMAHSSSSMSYGMYPFQSMNNVGNTPQVQGNGPAVPPVFMLYQYAHNMPLEFGSLGPVRLGEAQDGRLNGGVSRLDETPYYEQKHGTYQNNTSPSSSPTEPSSPDQHQRGL